MAEVNDQQSSNVSKNMSRRSSSSSRMFSIETTVTKLLISTKHLLQVLTQWSKGLVGGKGVSDAYVQLGNDFKLVSKYFTQHEIDVSDLGDVPLQLRRVLELTLREKPCDQTLNKYLFQIREVIVTMLEKLKIKQEFLKNHMKKDPQTARSSQNHIRNTSVTSNISLVSTTSPINPNVGEKNPSKQQNNINNSVQKTQNSETEEDDKSEDTMVTANSKISPDGQESLVAHNNKEMTMENSDALSQLKKGTNIQRRASKRYSAYHMAKLTNQSTSEAIAAAAVANMSTVNVNNNNVHQIDNDDNSNNNNNNNKNLSITNESSNPITNEEMVRNGDNKIEKFNQPNPRISIHNDKDMYTIFLRLEEKTKKCHIPKVSSLNSLRLLFVERFAYSPGSKSFPNIYIKDPQYSEFYELEEHNLTDLQDGSVIELRSKGESLQVEKYMTDVIETFKSEIKKSQNEILRVVNKIQENNFKITNTEISHDMKNDSTKSNQIDVQQMLHNLSILKQIYTTNKKETNEKIQTILSKVEEFKSSSFDSNNKLSGVSTYVEKSQDKLGDISENLLSKVDDLQDLIEILRKDVANRGATPSNKRLESLNKEIKEAEEDLKNMQKFISTEKPHWKKIWEEELDKVCEEQQFLTLQEDLIVDLEEDLHRTSETFDLVKLCCEEKEKNRTKTKVNPPIMPLLKPGTFNQVREQVLLEVQSLNPDHEGRQDAIERAEKLWEREKLYKEDDEFKDELGNFVENSSLRKSGGVEAVEQLRQQKDAENLRNNFSNNF